VEAGMQNIDWINLLINWFPMLLLIGVWVFFLRRMGGMGGSGSLVQYRKDHMAEMRRQTEALERIAKQLDNKAP
jgi:ATP-dependent Zn protease